MKPAATHRLRNLSFDLQLRIGGGGDQERARQMQQRLSAYCREQLEQVLQPCFDEAAGDAQVYQIRRIELDLGRIAPEHLESDLSERLRAALRTRLRRLGLPRRSQAVAVGGSGEADPVYWQALVEWLERGEVRADLRPADLLQQAVTHAPIRLASTLRRTSKAAEVSRRLASALPEPVIEQTVGVLVPSDAAYVIGCARRLRHVELVGTQVRAGSHDFRVALWAFVLHYLLDSRGSEFNRRAFVAATLRQMAAHYRMSFAGLLDQLTRSIEGLMTREGRPGSLLGTLYSLRRDLGEAQAESAQALAAANDSGVTVLEPAERRLHALIALLQGRADRHDRETLGALDACLADLSRRLPLELQAALRSSLHSEDARRRMMRGLPANRRDKLWRWLAPVHARRIGAVLGSLKRALRDESGPQSDTRLDGAALEYWASATAPFDSARFARGVLSRYAEMNPVPAHALLHEFDAGRFPADATWLLDRRDERPQEPNAASTVDRLRNGFKYGLWDVAPGVALRDWLAQLPDDVVAQTAMTVGPTAAARIVREFEPARRERLLRLLAGKQAGDLIRLRSALPDAARQLQVPEHELLRQADLSLLTSLLDSVDDLTQWGSRMAQSLAMHTLREYGEVMAALGLAAPAPEPVSDPAAEAALHRQVDAWLDHGYFAEPMSATTIAALCRAIEQGASGGPGRTGLVRTPQRPLDFIRAELARRRWPRRAINLARPVWLPHAPRSDGADLAQWVALLTTGNSPWWGDDGRYPQRRFERLLDRQPDQLTDALRKAIVYPRVLPRLLDWLPAVTRRRLLLTLSPDAGGLILSWINAGSALANSPALTGSQRRHAARVHWEVALSLLLRPHGDVFSAASFLDDAARRVAHKLELPEARYRDALSAVAAKGAERAARYAVLAELLGGDPPSDRSSAHIPEPIEIARVRYRLADERRGSDRAPRGTEPGRGDEAVLAALENMLRYSHPLHEEARRTLAELSAAAANWPAARRRAWRRFFYRVFAQSVHRQRLASLLPRALLLRLLPLWLAPAQIAAVDIVLEQLGTLTILPGQGRYRREAQAWDALFEQLHLQRGSRWALPRFVSAVADRLAEHHKPSPLELLAAMEHALPGSEAELRRSVRQARRMTVVSSFPKPPSRPIPYIDPDRQPLPADAPLYVQNAGLVLLWPFLPRFFEMLHLVENDDFVDEVARSRAVYLLHYLACGEDDAPEDALTLNKFLCGMPLTRAPELVDPPREDEKDLARGLLYSVTQQWGKLNGTSIEGLQETFLRREGRLSVEEKRATLTVEKKTVDILQESMPWSYSTIRAPWLAQVLFVKWR
ncbi:contractile injection system tape measure protein [Trinickia dinghuensis]|uniref:Uncharacterized protein n=1 Tax=Trinickia dinghuensis TaxID=2291023 RepID=A0A3D8JY44_9BURK|nr:contractile injection system tape measure protein [Trinickia dinghuensis]RDU97545.1 hypothetical protein DWV00_16810 [Trinickia dinghuensis]